MTEPQDAPVTITMPKMPDGTEPVLSVSTLVGSLLGPANPRWVQLDDHFAVQLRPWVSDAEQLPLLEAEARRRQNPAAYFRASRAFIVAAVVPEHRAQVEKWLDDAGLPSHVIASMASNIYTLTMGIPFDEPPVSGGS